LELALGSEVAGEASAGSRFVVAGSAPGAIAPLSSAISAHNVSIGRAFAKGAVRSTGANVTDAALLLDRVPRGVVCLAGFAGELLGGNADTTPRAVVRADGTFAGITIVVVEALACASLAVALSLVGALGTVVAAVILLGDGNPCSTHGASASGAVVASPCGVNVARVSGNVGLGVCNSGVVVLLGVARALIVSAACAVAGAAVRAVGLREAQGGKDGNGEELEHGC